MAIADRIKDEREHKQVMDFMENNIKSITVDRRPIEMAVFLTLGIFARFNQQILDRLVKIYKAPDQKAAIYHLQKLWEALNQLIKLGELPPDSIAENLTREELILIASKEIIKRFETEAIRLLEAIEKEKGLEQAQYYMAIACIRCGIEPNDIETVIAYLK